MKRTITLVAMMALMTGITSTFAQGFEPPSEGKAVIYIVRPTAYGFAASFEFFHNDKYIGVFKGKNYMRYECDPGEQLIWASSENKDFVTCDLEAGGTYILQVDVIMGAMKARVGFTTFGVDDTERFERSKELIMNEAPVVTPEKTIEKRNEKLEKFIAKQLDNYENDWKETENYRHISPDMAIPPEAME